MNQLAKTSETIPQPVSEGAALIAMIERVARDPSIDLDRMERLQSMLERAQQTRREVAYSVALATMQPELPEIVEHGKINIGQGKGYTFALWEDICDAIKPVLGKYGFSIQFRSSQVDKQIVITCRLRHCEGHFEETSIPLPVDVSGSKNAVQAVGSTFSYGQRYTAKLLLNLTSRGEDDDAVSTVASKQTITDDQINILQHAIVEAGIDIQSFYDRAKIKTLEELPAIHFNHAMQWIKDRKKANERDQAAFA